MKTFCGCEKVKSKNDFRACLGLVGKSGQRLAPFQHWPTSLEGCPQSPTCRNICSQYAASIPPVPTSKFIKHHHRTSTLNTDSHHDFSNQSRIRRVSPSKAGHPFYSPRHCSRMKNTASRQYPHRLQSHLSIGRETERSSRSSCNAVLWLDVRNRCRPQCRFRRSFRQVAYPSRRSHPCS